MSLCPPRPLPPAMAHVPACPRPRARPLRAALPQAPVPRRARHNSMAARQHGGTTARVRDGTTAQQHADLLPLLVLLPRELGHGLVVGHGVLRRRPQTLEVLRRLLRCGCCSHGRCHGRCHGLATSLAAGLAAGLATGPQLVVRLPVVDDLLEALLLQPPGLGTGSGRRETSSAGGAGSRGAAAGDRGRQQASAISVCWYCHMRSARLAAAVACAARAAARSSFALASRSASAYAQCAVRGVRQRTGDSRIRGSGHFSSHFGVLRGAHRGA